MTQKSQDTSIDTLVADLANPDLPLRATLVYRLSSISSEDLIQVQAAWNTLPLERRRLLLARLAETSENNFEVDFTDFALFAMTDEDAEVRQSAVGALWYNIDSQVMQKFISLLAGDANDGVRAAAAEALGRFVLAAQLGDLPEQIGFAAEEALLAALNSVDKSPLVHRHALESLAYSNREELKDLIETAHEDERIELRASAVFAMGRSADEHWSRHILRALDSDDPEIRFEAARATGELLLGSAVAKLIRLTSETSDREIREAAIWSLGEIGGSESQAALMRLADQEVDEDLLEVIEDALSSAQLASGQLGAIVLQADDEVMMDIDDDSGDDDGES
jgi:HEAT repeat protein